MLIAYYYVLITCYYVLITYYLKCQVAKKASIICYLNIAALLCGILGGGVAGAFGVGLVCTSCNTWLMLPGPVDVSTHMTAAKVCRSTCANILSNVVILSSTLVRNGWTVVRFDFKIFASDSKACKACTCASDVGGMRISNKDCRKDQQKRLQIVR